MGLDIIKGVYKDAQSKLSPKDIMVDDGGRLLARPVAAKDGATMYYSGPHFTAALANSIKWNRINPVPPFNETSTGYASIAIYKPDGTPTSISEEAGITVVDITIDKDLELIGGSLSVPVTLPTGNNDSDWLIWCVAAPEIPQAQGGQIPFIEHVQLNNFYEAEDVVIDGRVTKTLPYIDLGGGITTNKMRNILKHPTGLKPDASPATDVAKFQLLYDMYIKW